MPCTYYDDRDYLRMAREDLDKLTRLLCTATKMLEGAHVLDAFRIPSAAEDRLLWDWWKEHKERDAKKAAAERENTLAEIAKGRALKSARAKLSPEERKILGIR